MPFARQLFVDTLFDSQGEATAATTLSAGIDTDDTALAFVAVDLLPDVGSDGGLQSNLFLKSASGVEPIILKSRSGLGGVIERGPVPLSHASGAEVFIGPLNAAALNRLTRSMTAAYDMERLGIDGALVRIPIGTNGQLLTVVAGVPAWADAPSLAAYALTAAVVPNTRTVNGHALSADVTVTKSDLSLGNVENTALSTWAGSTSLTTLGAVATGTWGGTAIAANKGGTGQTGYTPGDLLQATGASALSALAAVATGNALISGGVGTASAWGKIGLTTHVSGILPVANGGTGIAYFTAAGPTTARTYTFPDANATVLTSNAAVTVGQGGSGAATLTGALIGNGTSAFTAVSPSRGGLLYGNSSTAWAALAVGTVGKVLQSDGTDISWATPTGTGVPVLATSPTLVTPVLGVATGTSLATTSFHSSTQSIAAVSTDGVVLTNVTAAAAGAQQWSPRLRLTGQGWKTTATAASQTVDWIIENQPVEGTTAPTSTLVMSSQVAAGGFTSRLVVNSAGQILATADGGGSAVAFGRSTSVNTGLYFPGTNQVGLSANGTSMSWSGLTLFLPTSASLNWNSDTFVFRDAANTWAQRNLTAAQIRRNYNTFTTVDTAGEWLEEAWASNVAHFGTLRGSSTGTARVLSIDYGGVQAGSRVSAISIPITNGNIVFGGGVQLSNAAVTGLVAGVLAASTNASIVLYDSGGQAYRVPCII